MLLTNVWHTKQKLAVPSTAGIKTAATPPPLGKTAVIHRGTQSSEVPLMETLVISFREKTPTLTQNPTLIAHHAHGEIQLIPSAAPRYLGLLRPLDMVEVATDPLLSPWNDQGAQAATDPVSVETSAKTAALLLMTRGPPVILRALHFPFKCRGTPPRKAPWSPLSQAGSLWDLQGGTGRRMP